MRGILWEKVSETLTEGVVVVDPRGTIIAVNHAMEEITGYRREELVGQSCCHDQERMPASAGPGRGPQSSASFSRMGSLRREKCALVKKDGCLGDM